MDAGVLPTGLFCVLLFGVEGSSWRGGKIGSQLRRERERREDGIGRLTIRNFPSGVRRFCFLGDSKGDVPNLLRGVTAGLGFRELGGLH